jgi:phosphatidylserine decarboxylase
LVNACGTVAVGLLWTVDTFRLLGPTPPAFGWALAAVTALAVLWTWLLLFFIRDPERAVGDGVVSPADGRVTAAQSSGLGANLSVFLGVLSVHVVRAPIAGRVTTLAYKPGGRRFAFSKESHLNERLVMGLAGVGETCSLTLIAGAFADRIQAYVETGTEVAKGDRIGIIKFGSRVDLEYASDNPRNLAVKAGDMVIAGQTSILLLPREGPPS